MLHTTFYLTFALVACTGGFSSRAEAQTAQGESAPAGTISGKVTFHGKALPGIIIALRRADGDSQFSPSARATSAPDGSYSLRGVRRGRWLVIPYAPAFVAATQDFRSTGGKMIVVAAGESVADVDFDLLGGGVITGRVTDSDGRSVIEERLSLIATDSTIPGGAARNIEERRVIMTDDRGVYRIFGVAAGRYKVAVGQPPNSARVATVRPAYQQTFYPGTTSLEKATVVEVTEGGEASQIDIVVGRALQSFRASGHIIDGETDKRVPDRRGGISRLSDNNNPNMYSTTYISNKKGEFQIEGLLPGRYAIFIQPDQNLPGYSELVQFEVMDKDVEGLVLKTQPGATLSGKVVVEGVQDKTFLAKLSQMRLNVYAYSAAGLPNWHSAIINPDGSFQLRGLPPGTASFNTVSSADPSLVKNLLILHTERFGIEQPRGIEMKANDHIDGLTVVIAFGTGVVRGEVRYENGALPPGARVTVRVTRTDKVNPLTGAEVDARGRFEIERLPPGSYWLDAAAYSPLVRGGISQARQQINVTGGTIDILVTLDLKPNTRP